MLFPIGERTVVQKNWMADQTSGEEHRCRLLSDVAIPNDCVVRLHARPREQCSKLVGGVHLAVCQVDVTERKALRARNMSKSSAVASATRDAVIEDSVARVDDGYSRALFVRSDIVRIDDNRPDLEVGKLARLRRRHDVCNGIVL